MRLSPHFKRIICKDGFTMSVQASETHYSSPRTHEGPWDSFEVGFPTAKERLLMPYVEDKKRPTDTVYAYVPAEVVEKVIKKHGGVDILAMFAAIRAD